MPDNSDKKFLKYKARILAINGGTPSDPRLPYDIHVGAFRGYADDEVIRAGTPLMDIIRKEFESTPVSYTISISSTGPGTVSPTGSQSVIRGGSLTVTATPNAGCQIKSFKVDGAEQTSPYVFTNVQANHTVVVEFETIPVTSHTITASAGTGGSITPSGNVTVADGGNQMFTVEANANYTIADVLVDGVSQGPIMTATYTYTFSNVTADHTISASFNYTPPVTVYVINASAGANGSISPNGMVTVADGGSQTFTITPNTGYVVDDVLVDGSSVGAVSTYPFTNVTANHTISATFAAAPAVTYTITTSANAGGTITPTATVNAGANANVVITPNSGYQIKTVTVDGSAQTVTPTGMTIPFNNVSADHTVVAEFEVIPVTTHTITVTVGANGTISPAGPVTVSDGADQIFTITANSGYEIEDVKADGVSVGAVSDYTFTNVTADHTISATFKVIPVTTYTVTPSAGTGGSISPNTAQTVNSGGSVTFTATPDTGYKVKDWKLDGASQSETGATFTVSNVTADHTVAVEFEVIPSGNIYNQAYTPGNGRQWQEPTAAIIVPGTPAADPAAVLAQIKGAGYSWTSKAQSKSIETFLIAKSLGRITNMISAIGSEMLNNGFSEKTITLDGVDYWCYYASETVGAGNSTYTLKGV